MVLFNILKLYLASHLTFPLAGGQLDEEAGGVQAALDRGAHVCG